MILRPAQVEASWYGRVRLGRVETALLLVLSWGYAAVIWLRRRVYQWGILKTVSLPVEVLVVGKVIVGGAGKKPVARARGQQVKA